ncbi:hypothetical protein ACTXT7_009146 [Hymenolepis weldensis]
MKGYTKKGKQPYCTNGYSHVKQIRRCQQLQRDYTIFPVLECVKGEQPPALNKRTSTTVVFCFWNQQITASEVPNERSLITAEFFFDNGYEFSRSKTLNGGRDYYWPFKCGIPKVFQLNVPKLQVDIKPHPHVSIAEEI